MTASPPPTPVVFASGQLLTPELWGPTAAALADRPLSFADNQSDDTVQAMAERLLADAPPRFDLVAHAMGGFVAFAVMRTAPDRVRRLALLSTLAPADTPVQTVRREGYLRLVEAGRFDEVVEERLPILLHPARREDPTFTTLARHMAAETGPETFLRQQRAIMTRPDSRPGLPAIVCPTLVIAGRQDGIVTQAHQDEIASGIPDARLEWLEHCGHLITVEQPAAVNALLRAFLDAP